MPHGDDQTSEREAFRRLMGTPESELPKTPDPPSIFKQDEGLTTPEEDADAVTIGPLPPGGIDPPGQVREQEEPPDGRRPPVSEESKTNEERMTDALEEILAELILIHDQLDNALGGG